MHTLESRASDPIAEIWFWTGPDKGHAEEAVLLDWENNRAKGVQRRRSSWTGPDEGHAEVAVGN